MDYTNIPFIIPPFYIIQLFFVTQTIIMLKILRKKNIEEAITPRSFISIESMIGLIIPILTFYSIIIIGGLQAIGTSNWQLFVLPLMIGGILSIFYFIRAMWIFPSKVSLISHSLIIIYEILAITLLTTSYPTTILIIAPFFLVIGQIFFRKWKPKPLWDHRRNFAKYFSLKFNFILWVICFIESALQTFGYSLFLLI